MPAFCRPLGVAAHGAREHFSADRPRCSFITSITYKYNPPPFFVKHLCNIKVSIQKFYKSFSGNVPQIRPLFSKRRAHYGRRFARIDRYLSVKCVLPWEASRVRTKCILLKPRGYAPPKENPRSRERLRGFYDTFLIIAAECDKRFTCRPGRRYRAELCLRGIRGWRRRRWRYASLCRHSPAARPPPRCRRRR